MVRSSGGSAAQRGDALLPAQLASLLGRGRVQRPEQRLMAAILEDAIHAYLREDYRRSHERRAAASAAEAWFAADGSPALFPFEYVCDVLGLDATAVRSALQRRRGAMGCGG